MMTSTLFNSLSEQIVS